MNTPVLRSLVRSLFVNTLLLAGSLAQAQSSGSVYGGVGSFGLGAGYGLPLGKQWVARFGLHTGTLGSVEDGDTLEGVYYDTKAKIKPGLSALLDYYPMAGSGFRLSGGLVYAPFKADLTGRPEADGNYSLNGNSYSASQVGALRGTVKYNGLSPYLGIGWESRRPDQAGWRFVTELGVYYLGESSVSLSASGGANSAALRRDVEAERRALEKTGVGLAVSLGAAYAF